MSFGKVSRFPCFLSSSFPFLSFLFFPLFFAPETINLKLLPKVVFYVRKCTSFSHRVKKYSFFTDHNLKEYCLSLILLFFHILYIVLPLLTPIFFTENQPDVSVGENGEERGR
jgi:hypothetical protein